MGDVGCRKFGCPTKNYSTFLCGEPQPPVFNFFESRITQSTMVLDAALAIDLEKDALLRSRARELSRLTFWASPSTVGVASMKSCALNSRLLEITARFWVERSDLVDKPFYPNWLIIIPS